MTFKDELLSVLLDNRMRQVSWANGAPASAGWYLCRKGGRTFCLYFNGLYWQTVPSYDPASDHDFEYCIFCPHKQPEIWVKFEDNDEYEAFCKTHPAFTTAQYSVYMPINIYLSESRAVRITFIDPNMEAINALVDAEKAGQCSLKIDYKQDVEQ